MITPKTFLIADTHFSHANILLYEPSRQVAMQIEGHESMNELLIDRWNSVVGENDRVLHLGDFAFKNDLSVVKHLNGSIILLPGNHDKGAASKFLRAGFGEVIGGLHIQSDNQKQLHHTIWKAGLLKPPKEVHCLIADLGDKRLLFSHYPAFYIDPHQKVSLARKYLNELFEVTKCDFNIHGHIHSKTTNDSRLINASVEHWEFKPVRLEDMLKMV